MGFTMLTLRNLALFVTIFPLNSHGGIAPRAPQQPPPPLVASNPSRERGIEYLKKGDRKAAIASLRDAVKENKADADAWYYLGLALNRENETKSARKAFEKAVQLRPDFAAAHAALACTMLLANKSRGDAEHEAQRALTLDAQNVEARYALSMVRLREGNPSKALEEVAAALKINANVSALYLVKTQALLAVLSGKYNTAVARPESAPPLSREMQKERRIAQATLYKQAAESLGRFLELDPQVEDADVWREQLESLRVYAKYADEPDAGRTIFSGADDITKAVILSKPEPGYTERARQNNIEGIVRLRLVLSADGRVEHILVLRSLSHGLTEKCVEVARKIKFIPATKDGRPVSQFVTVEYNFNVY